MTFYWTYCCWLTKNDFDVDDENEDEDDIQPLLLFCVWLIITFDDVDDVDNGLVLWNDASLIILFIQNFIIANNCCVSSILLHDLQVFLLIKRWCVPWYKVTTHEQNLFTIRLSRNLKDYQNCLNIYYYISFFSLMKFQSLCLHLLITFLGVK